MNLSIGSNSLNTMTSEIAGMNQKAEDLKNMINNSASDEEMMNACKSFEAYLLEQAFKGMKKSVSGEEEDNPYLAQFGDMLYEEYAKSATEKEGLGIARMLYESMKRDHVIKTQQ